MKEKQAENEEVKGQKSSLEKWEKVVREEEIIQAAAMPLEDVPSCLNLFDKWAACYALGPQIRNIYRYGSINKCQDKLEDLKYCFTLKGLTAEEHRQLWLRRRAEGMASKRLEKSSEDVWEMRRDPIVDPAYIDPMFSKSDEEPRR